MPKGGKKGKAEKPPPENHLWGSTPFYWPDWSTPKVLVSEVPNADSLSKDEYNSARQDVPWQFRPPMRHEPYREEVDSMRPHVLRLLEQCKAKEQQRRLEEASMRASKGGKKGRSRK